MGNSRVLEDYRRHRILSMLQDGKYKGRMWKGKELLEEIEGDTLEEVMSELRNLVDQRFVAIAENRSSAPEAPEYARAFQAIINDLSDGHLSMLKAHYLAPNQERTATQLAEAAGYANYGAANLQYGLVGKKLNEELPITLPKRQDGSPIYTYALATAGDRTSEEEHWVWKLRPEVAYAIEALGLCA
jgi:hypothetical protein